MSDITSKICTLPRKELEKVAEDLWCRAIDIQHLTYLLMGNLEDALSQSRGMVDGDTVTLRFQKRGIDCTQWLASRAWVKAADLLKILDDMYSDAAMAVEPVGMVGGQRNG